MLVLSGRGRACPPISTSLPGAQAPYSIRPRASTSREPSPSSGLLRLQPPNLPPAPSWPSRFSLQATQGDGALLRRSEQGRSGPAPTCLAIGRIVDSNTRTTSTSSRAMRSSFSRRPKSSGVHGTGARILKITGPEPIFGSGSGLSKNAITHRRDASTEGPRLPRACSGAGTCGATTPSATATSIGRAR